MILWDVAGAEKLTNMTVGDVAGRNKEAQPLTSKDSAEVANVFKKFTNAGL